MRELVESLSVVPVSIGDLRKGARTEEASAYRLGDTKVWDSWRTMRRRKQDELFQMAVWIHCYPEIHLIWRLPRLVDLLALIVHG